MAELSRRFTGWDGDTVDARVMRDGGLVARALELVGERAERAEWSDVAAPRSGLTSKR